MSGAWSEPAHWLLRSHRLGAECFTTGVPDKVKGRWFEQADTYRGRGGKERTPFTKKKKKKCQGALRARFPVQAMDCKTLPVLTRGKRFMSVMSVLKKIAAIKLTIFQMGTGGPLGQKRHN